MADPLVPSETPPDYERGPYRTLADVQAAMLAGGPAALHAGAQYLADTLMGRAERGEWSWLDPRTLASALNAAAAQLHTQWPAGRATASWGLHVRFAWSADTNGLPLYSTHDTEEAARAAGDDMARSRTDVVSFEVHPVAPHTEAPDVAPLNRTHLSCGFCYRVDHGDRTVLTYLERCHAHARH